MKHIYLVRHGRQDSKRCNVDVPLSPEGRRQAELLSERLKDAHFDKFYSSKLLRAMETADIINLNQGMEIERRSELNEIDWGDLTGSPDDTMHEKWGELLSHRAECTEDVRFPGGESSEDVYERAAPVFREIEESPYESILIVTHGGFIRAMIAGLLGLDFSKALAFGKVLENTSVTEFRYDEKLRRYTLERLNDHSHLEGHPELMRASWGLGKKK